MLHVLFSTPRFFPAQGGVENHVYQVARRLVAAGHRATVFTARHDRSLPPSVTLEGIQIRRFLAYPAGSDLFFAPDMARAIQTERAQFDILHLQNYLTAVAPVAMAAAQRARLPYVVTFHGGGHSQSWRNHMRQLQGLALRPLLRHARALIATARFEIEYYGTRLGLQRERFRHISNGCDIGTRQANTPSVTRPLIISIGRLERYKGHHRVLNAFPHVLAERPDIRLRLLGDGPYESELRALATQLGVADKVEIGSLPIAERQKMAETLASAELVTLISEFETQPMAALEAIALGCRVLVADTSGLSELAQDGLAQAVPLETPPTQLAAAMLAQMRTAKPTAPVTLPTWDICTQQLLALYQEIISDTSGVRR